MAIERQVPDPAQTAEPVQDLTTERSADDLDEQMIDAYKEGYKELEKGDVIYDLMDKSTQNYAAVFCRVTVVHYFRCHCFLWNFQLLASICSR